MFVKCFRLLSAHHRPEVKVWCLDVLSYLFRAEHQIKASRLGFDKKFSERGSMGWCVCISSIDPNIQQKLYHQTSKSIYSDVVYPHKYELEMAVLVYSSMYMYQKCVYWHFMTLNVVHPIRISENYPFLFIYLFAIKQVKIKVIIMLKIAILWFTPLLSYKMLIP